MSFNADRHETSRSWVLSRGQAQTFVANTTGVLRVSSGRAWVTLNHARPHSEPVAQPAIANDDLFLDSTSNLSLQAGQVIVLEAWSVEPATELTLVWEAATFSTSTRRWQQTVAQPAHELAQGLVQAGLALAKMVQGLFSYTLLLLTRPYKLR